MQEDLSNIKILFSNIEKLYKEYDERKTEQSEKGNLYNVFYVLGLWSEEVKFHSAFIADLLNPDGWHCQKDIFLKEFCSLLGYDNLTTKNAQVEIEKDLGDISENQKKGGRLDISVILKTSTNEDFTIIIENKIYAKDQKKQLIRYKNYAEKNFEKNYEILYLTLDGKDPTAKSVGFDVKEKNSSKIFWRNISYFTFIKEWLKKCLNIVNNKPNIQSVIKQYYDLIMELTGQGGDMEMSDKIQKLLLSKHNLRDAELLANEIEVTKQTIIDKNFRKICEQIKPEECKSFEFDVDINKACSFFSYILKNNITITFQFQEKRCKDFSYGIAMDNNIDIETRKKIRKLIINNKINQCHNEWWLWYRDFDFNESENLRNWDVDTLDTIINSPNTIKKALKKIIDDIIKVLKENNLL